LKILSQAGKSLADVYDIEGSIAGVEDLLSKDVHLVHEMGGQIFSERLESLLITLSSTAILQSTTFDIQSAAPPDSINRIAGAIMYADAAAEVSFAQLSITDTSSATPAELPIMAWDAAVDAEVSIRTRLDGAAIGTLQWLRPVQPPLALPALMTRMGAASSMPVISFRGQTLAFGAGTSTTLAVILLVRPDPLTTVPGGPMSHGLPIPSW